MANPMMWYSTSIPEEVSNLLVDDLRQYDASFVEGSIANNVVEKNIRDSKVYWIPSSHWSSGLCYHYILQSNEVNFKYDLFGWGNFNMQYTSYKKGEYYNWHVDSNFPDWVHDLKDDHQNNFIKSSSERIRKLSFTLQLSDPSEYEGGELQFLSDNNNTFFAPKSRGSIIIFDSRLRHRVKKVLSGERKSLVGWVTGPRWK